eukprot:GILK01015435.1.p1 GENE.GILK01015435.1~~GILK01015435.1.p1  ORF type:complete len:853 (-),score=83.33 GILK01015435.1:106-2664(-)
MKYLTSLLFDTSQNQDLVFQSFDLNAYSEQARREEEERLFNFVVAASCFRKTKQTRGELAHTSAVVLLRNADKMNCQWKDLLSGWFCGYAPFSSTHRTRIYAQHVAFVLMSTTLDTTKTNIKWSFTKQVLFPNLTDGQVLRILKSRLLNGVKHVTSLPIHWNWPNNFHHKLHRIWDRSHNLREVFRCLDKLVTSGINAMLRQVSGPWGNGISISLSDRVDIDGKTIAASWCRNGEESRHIDIDFSDFIDDIDKKTEEKMANIIDQHNVERFDRMLDVLRLGERIRIDRVFDVMKLDGVSILETIVRRGSSPMLYSLLEFPCRHEFQFSQTRTAYHVACRHLPDCVAASITRALLEYPHRCDIDTGDAEGNTALHWPVSNELSETVKVLLEFHASWDVTNKKGFAAAYGVDGKICFDRAVIDAFMSHCRFREAIPSYLEDYENNLQQHNQAKRALKRTSLPEHTVERASKKGRFDEQRRMDKSSTNDSTSSGEFVENEGRRIACFMPRLSELQCNTLQFESTAIGRLLTSDGKTFVCAAHLKKCLNETVYGPFLKSIDVAAHWKICPEDSTTSSRAMLVEKAIIPAHYKVSVEKIRFIDSRHLQLLKKYFAEKSFDGEHEQLQSLFDLMTTNDNAEPFPSTDKSNSEDDFGNYDDDSFSSSSLDMPIKRKQNVNSTISELDEKIVHAITNHKDGEANSKSEKVKRQTTEACEAEVGCTAPKKPASKRNGSQQSRFCVTHTCGWFPKCKIESAPDGRCWKHRTEDTKEPICNKNCSRATTKQVDGRYTLTCESCLQKNRTKGVQKRDRDGLTSQENEANEAEEAVTTSKKKRRRDNEEKGKKTNKEKSTTSVSD